MSKKKQRDAAAAKTTCNATASGTSRLIAPAVVAIVALAAATLRATLQHPAPLPTEPSHPEEDEPPFELLSRAATVTAPLEIPEPTPAAGAALLADLVGMPAPEFWERVWERSPMHVHGAGAARLAPLLSLGAIDSVLQANVSTRGDDPDAAAPLRNHGDMALIRLTERDGEQWTGRWGAEGAAVPLAVLKAGFLKGFSLLLNEVEERVPAVAQLCAALEAYVHIRCNANLYLTPQRTQAPGPPIAHTGRSHLLLYTPSAPASLLTPVLARRSRRTSTGWTRSCCRCEQRGVDRQVCAGRTETRAAGDHASRQRAAPPTGSSPLPSLPAGGREGVAAVPAAAPAAAQADQVQAHRRAGARREVLSQGCMQRVSRERGV